jgi:ATP-dependent DNA helicase RecG
MMTQEKQNVEWKESWRDEYLKWICGFANAVGGQLYIGINDDGKVIGLNDVTQLLVEIPNNVRDILGIMVAVNLLQKDNLSYLEIIVESYPYPINYKGQYHYRSGSTKQELKGLALNKFLLEKTGNHWDAVPLPNLTINDLDDKAFDLFRKRAAKSKRVENSVLQESNDSLLHHLNLYENGFLKRAALLLFHPIPDRFITGAYIKIGFFSSPSDIVYQDEIHGPLFEQVDKTMDLLLTKYMSAYISYNGIYREENYPYPEIALREALLNAVAHKDYSSGSPIQIKVYKDGLFIWNDGEMPNNWTIETLLITHASKSRNPDISNTFFRAGMVESWGRGISKILDECEKENVPKPSFDLSMGGVDARFIPKIFESNTTLSPETTQKSTLESTLKSTLKSALKTKQLIEENPHITISELAEKLSISKRAVDKQVAKLKENGIMERIGPDKGGYWKIIEKENI